MKIAISALFAVVLMLPGPAAAEAEDAVSGGQIYRTVDADGNVMFTDSPAASQSAQEVQLSPGNAYRAPQRRQSAPSPAATAQSAQGYQSLAIVSPESKSTLRNVFEPLPVKASLSPSLAEGHQLVLFDNGVAQAELALDMPTPGVHVLQLKVLDQHRQVLISSEPIEVYVHRTTVNDRQTAPPSQGGGARPGETARPGGTAGRAGSTSRQPSGPARPGGAARPAAPATPAR